MLDDDPTGSQTLHSCPLLLRWDHASLRRGLAHPSPFLFLLANTRALEPQAARERVREICRALLPALEQARRDGVLDHWLIVSRGDSTLRGHTPLEVETIAEEWAAADQASAASGSDGDPPRFSATAAGAAAPPATPPRGAAARRAGPIPSAAQAARLAPPDGGPAAALRPGEPGAATRDGDAGGLSRAGSGPQTNASGAAQAGVAGFDACLLVPAFLPGGRTTRAGVHLLEGRPVHTTAFARDRLFGYSTSHLPDWLEHKSGGRIPASRVQRLGLQQLDAAAADLEAGAGDGPAFRALCHHLADLAPGSWLAVDAERPQQLAALGAAVRELTAPSASERWGRPRRFLFQSAASLLNGLVDIGPPPLDPAALASLRRRGSAGPLPGLVLVGSHVPLADRQLQRLLAEPRCEGVEIPVPKLQRLLDGPLPDRLLPSLEATWLERLQGALAAGRTPVLYTSRGEVSCARPQQRIALGLALAALMARLAAALAPQLGYLISKGGITSHTLLADGLNLAAVELQGQLLPGLSLVLAGEAALPVLTFPGNLGDDDSLRQAWMRMEKGAPPSGDPP